MAAGAWRPARLGRLWIREPKRRLIVRPRVDDRIVHTGLVEALRGVFDRALSAVDFGCRPGFGQHRAVLALEGAMRRHRFAVHLDVRRFFPTIRPARLLEIVACRVRDNDLLRLIEVLCAQGPPLYADPAVRRALGCTSDEPPPGVGLPIGTALSQYLAAHVWLFHLDHHLKRRLRVPTVVRYVDDIFLFGQRRADLRAWRGAVSEWLARERGQRLKHPQARVLSCAGHLDALGYRVRRDGHVALPGALRRMSRRAQAHLCDVDGPDLRRSLASTAGIVTF